MDRYEVYCLCVHAVQTDELAFVADFFFCSFSFILYFFRKGAENDACSSPLIYSKSKNSHTGTQPECEFEMCNKHRNNAIFLQMLFAFASHLNSASAVIPLSSAFLRTHPLAGNILPKTWSIPPPPFSLSVSFLLLLCPLFSSAAMADDELKMELRFCRFSQMWLSNWKLTKCKKKKTDGMTSRDQRAEKKMQRTKWLESSKLWINTS